MSGGQLPAVNAWFKLREIILLMYNGYNREIESIPVPDNLIHVNIEPFSGD